MERYAGRHNAKSGSKETKVGKKETIVTLSHLAQRVQHTVILLSNSKFSLAANGLDSSIICGEKKLAE